MSLVIGLDVSTTAAKAIVVGEGGRLVAEGRASFALENPSPDAWEQDPRAWTDAAFEAVGQAVRGLSPADQRAVRAIAVTHQRETFAFVDPNGEALAPGIVWMDARSRPEVALATKEMPGEEITTISGKVPCTTPSLYKIRMLLERLSPSIAGRDKRLVDVGALVVFALTGQWVTSVASADPLGLIDMSKARWSTELCELARVRPSDLPALATPGEAMGVLRPDVANRLGLAHEVVVVAGAGDGQAAAIGAGAIDEKTAYLNVGTAVVAGVHATSYRVSRSFRTLFGAIPGTFLLESDLKGGTLTLDWLADRLLGEGRFERTDARMSTLASLEDKAKTLPPGAQGLMALPYWAGVMNPHWDDEAGGALVGLRADHGPEHLYRAICEGLAFEQRLVLELIEAETRPIEQVVAVGGAIGRPFLLQLFADAMGRALARSAIDETTAYGAAMLAAPHAGLATDVAEAAAKMARPAPGATLGPSASIYTELYGRAYRGLYAALAPTLASIAKR